MSNYGKEIAIQMKITIRENGQTRTFFTRFPNNPKCFDRPPYALRKIIFWFLNTFPNIEPMAVAFTAAKYNVSTQDAILKLIMEDGQNGVK